MNESAVFEKETRVMLLEECWGIRSSVGEGKGFWKSKGGEVWMVVACVRTRAHAARTKAQKRIAPTYFLQLNTALKGPSIANKQFERCPASCDGRSKAAVVRHKAPCKHLRIWCAV